MAKTLVCTNVLDTVKSEIYGSHCQQWFQFGRRTSDEFILFHPSRLTIDTARNTAAKIALQNECDYILFLDDDMILSSGTYESLKANLIKYDGDVIMALTFIRGEPFEPMLFKYNEDKTELSYHKNWENDVDADGIVEVDAVGFACALLKCERLKDLSFPYFITGSGCTEDIHYCIKLKKKFSDAKILVDCNVPTGHLLNPEAISVHNIKELREYHSKYTKERENRVKDRGLEYMQKCKEMISIS